MSGDQRRPSTAKPDRTAIVVTGIVVLMVTTILMSWLLGGPFGLLLIPPFVFVIAIFTFMAAAVMSSVRRRRLGDTHDSGTPQPDDR